MLGFRQWELLKTPSSQRGLPQRVLRWGLGPSPSKYLIKRWTGLPARRNPCGCSLE